MSKQATKIRGKGRKTDTIKDISDKLAKTHAIFLTDYRGLTHQQMESMRRSLKKVQGEFTVAKNSLFKIALEKWNKDLVGNLETELKNPTGAFFAYGDEIEAIKEFAKFIKISSLPKVKIGVFDGKVVSDKDFSKLAALPSKAILHATLCMRLKSPIYGLHYGLRWNMVKLVTALDNVKGKKPSN